MISISGHYQSQENTAVNLHVAFFTELIIFAPWKRIWKSWYPLRCEFFIWLAIDNRCWTADCLAKRGLPYLAACALCDQMDETIQHTLVSLHSLKAGLGSDLPEAGSNCFSA